MSATAITYGRCSTCKGARVVPHILGPRRCTQCGGWGYTVDPPDQWEREMLGLAALWGQGAQHALRVPRRKLRLPIKRQT
jgi:hypothetical protein